MATRLYFRTSAHQGITGDTQDSLMQTTEGASQQGPAVDLVAADAPIQWARQTGGGGTLYSFVFQAAAVTISGTVTFNIWAAESNMNNNAGPRVTIDRLGPSGTHISNIVNSSRGVEFGTTMAVNNWTASPTSTTLASGDWLRVRVWAVAVGTMVASALSGATMNYNGSVAQSASTWVEFTETFTSGVPVVRHQRHFLPRRAGLFVAVR